MLTLKEVFNNLEATHHLEAALWEWYITESNKLTGKKVRVKKCFRRVKQAHAHLSDYYAKNQES